MPNGRQLDEPQLTVEMKLTGHGRPRPINLAEPPDDGLEELRARFLQRLKDERQRLRNLSAVLAQGKMDRVPVLDELRSRAHRMSGTAGILDLRGLAAAAAALERAVEEMPAADWTLVPREENSDRSMRAALRVLLQVIDSLGTPARDLRLHRRMVRPLPPR
jgi:HPt (histidine-containing phosphotransfer) domain-containing protein